MTNNQLKFYLTLNYGLKINLCKLQKNSLVYEKLQDIAYESNKTVEESLQELGFKVTIPLNKETKRKEKIFITYVNPNSIHIEKIENEKERNVEHLDYANQKYSSNKYCNELRNYNNLKRCKRG